MTYPVAALYIDPKGPYPGLATDCWPEERDARLYAGPLPVVAHPPCARWGRYWKGGPSRKWDRKLGDDGGCFRAAFEAVRKWGGVLEHPATSRAWGAFLAAPPPRGAGWIRDLWGGWTCAVEQGWYGHRARKLTWLYYIGPEPAQLDWRRSESYHGPASFTSPPPGAGPEYRDKRREWLRQEEARTGRAWCCPEMMCKREREITPPAFAEVLCRLAAGAARLGLVGSEA